MNRQNRKDLTEALDAIQEAVEKIRAIGDGEYDKYYNLPEGLRWTLNGLTTREIAEDLDATVRELETAIKDARALTK